MMVLFRLQVRLVAKELSRKKGIDYFDTYKLRTKKRLAFDKWSFLVSFVLDKKHLSPEGASTIKALAKQVNLDNSVSNSTGNK